MCLSRIIINETIKAVCLMALALLLSFTNAFSSSHNASLNLIGNAITPLTYTSPPANITACEDETVSIDLNISGVAPFTVNYQITDAQTGVSAPIETLILNDLELWEFIPSTNSTYVITEISDSSPTPCVINPMDAIEVSISENTQVNLLVEPYSCPGGMAFIDFKFESYTGPTFDITYVTQEEGGPLYNTTISNIDLSSLGTDSTYTELISFSFNTNTTFSLVSATDSGNGCVTMLPSNSLEMEVAPVSEAVLSGMGSVCLGEDLDMTLDLSGISPWVVVISRPESITDTTLTISNSPFTYSDSEVGVYNIVSITDSVGCTGTTSGSAELLQLDLPLASLSGSGILCSGQSAEVDIVYQGSGPFEVTITDPDGQEINVNSGIIEGDSLLYVSLSGDYVVTSVSNSECINTAPSQVFMVTEVSSPEVSLSGSDFICNADSTQLFITVLNGSAPFNYTLENTNTSETVILNEVSNLDSIYVHSSGEYIISGITDAHSCIGIFSSALELTERMPPIADAGINESFCNETELLLGATPNDSLTYEWTSSDTDILDMSTLPQPTVFLQHTSAADYLLEVYLKVYDGFCSDNDTKEISIHPTPEVNAGVDQSLCFGESTTLNGSGDGTLTWINDGNLSDYSVAAPEVLNTTSTDTFTLEVESTTNPGCTARDSVTISILTEIELTMSYTPELCFNECNAELLVQTSGGEGELNSSLRNSANVEVSPTDFNTLCADTYTFSVEDENLCSIDSVFTVNGLPEYFITDVSAINPVCFGDETGEITVTASGALQYFLSADSPQVSPNFNGLASGIYDIQVENAQGCRADTIVELTSNPEFTLTTNFSEQTACYGDVLNFQATADGGVGDYVYNWWPENTPFDTNSSSVDMNITESLIVQVSAMDATGECSTDTLTMEVILPPTISSSFIQDSIEICRDDELTLSSNPTGGAGTLNCIWSSAGMQDIENCNATVNPLITTSYMLTITDGCSLPLTEEVTVIVNQLPVPEFTVDLNTGCVPLTVEFTDSSVNASGETCSWNLSDGSEPLNTCGNFSHTYINYGSFTPSLTLTSAENCSATYMLAEPIEVHEPPLVDFEWNPMPVTTLDTEVQFFNQTDNGETFQWESTGLFSSSEMNPEFEFPPNVADSYTVCLNAVSEYGCESHLCQVLTVESTVLAHIPNAFSPDGDGYNEIFTPVTNGVSENDYNFRVFTRQGTIVFESNTPNEGWDGSVQNSDFFSPDGVYTWVLNVRGMDSSKTETFRGQVTVLR
ncbi:MAG: gliding motility-associated C-terminal domain-containing protein [Flavobacteriales bacterium]